MRNKIFISHATPSDNEFTKWLALKLITLGYEVWCDILYLEKGTDFWSSIEEEIRDNTVKFLIVLSEISNKSEGVLKELAVASKVKKQLDDSTFIVPLNIDPSLSYDDINIELVRLNAINFRNNWGTGLQDIIKFLEDNQISKNEINPQRSNDLYSQLFQDHNVVVDKDEIYDSNWFRVNSFPDKLHFHEFDWRMPKRLSPEKLSFPGVKYRKYLCTFATASDYSEDFPETFDYNTQNTISISIDEILSDNYDQAIIPQFECRRLIIQLINQSIIQTFVSHNLKTYQMSNRVGFWMEKGTIEKDKFKKILLVGKQKDKSWHYGISANTKLYPFPCLEILAHIYFTTDGKNLIPSKSIQQSARRRQGKNWWNDKWRTKLLAFIKMISVSEETFALTVGSKSEILVSSDPVKFIGKKTYIIPEKRILEEEIEISEYDKELDQLEEE